MMDLTQDIKITCQNSIMKGAGAHTVDGHPMRNWKIKLVAVDGGKEKKGRLTELLDHVEYILHPTFKDPRRVVTKEPYLLQEKGWGEFDMRIVLYFANNIANTELLSFDLNFRQAQYSVVKTLVFQSPSTELVNILNRDPAPLPPAKKRRSNSTEKARKTTKPPASPKASINTSTTNTARELDSMSGASLSPSTPHFTQQPAGYSSAYSASPQPHSFASPNGVINSPYDYTQNIKTPQAASEHDMHNNSNNNYLSDLSDDTRRPASHHQQHQLATGTGTGAGGAGSARKGPRQQRSDSSGSSYDGDDRTIKRRKAGQKQNGHRGHRSSSSSDTNGDDPDRGGGNNVKEDDDDQRIVDDVYTESDLNHVHAIHGSALTSRLRAAWGIPENVNMLELARKISSLEGDKLAEVRNIVDRFKTERMGIQIENDEVVVDLYSLGPDILTRLWDFTHSKE
ncbi:yeats family-domain-containing protein [Zychaea mexicana]|uniref:yeats family-domain-containing protein n=1 Tax=Zychaea mexicana TaxID=64656 RepID=UPI0022FF2B0F|nr:yeats family-domain-containing protein [Zychaea mexicana]KAI9498083.1 yeats family-domain-containing protein [Zychaea mexicana]